MAILTGRFMAEPGAAGGTKDNMSDNNEPILQPTPSNMPAGRGLGPMR
jgi:hypothetical protein